MKKAHIRVGTLVRLKPNRARGKALKRNETAKVESFVSDVTGGVRLDRALDGFTYWNVKDLTRVKEKGR